MATMYAGMVGCRACLEALQYSCHPAGLAHPSLISCRAANESSLCDSTPAWWAPTLMAPPAHLLQLSSHAVWLPVVKVAVVKPSADGESHQFCKPTEANHVHGMYLGRYTDLSSGRMPAAAEQAYLLRDSSCAVAHPLSLLHLVYLSVPVPEPYMLQKNKNH